YKVGKITVSGNKKTKDFVILREMQLKPGDYYNVITLRNKDYPKIYDLGYFEDLGDPEPEEGEDGTININIPVVEKNTGSFNIGIGYSSTSKLVGTLRVADTNFMGTGQGVSATWEQGTRSGFKGKGSWELAYNNPWIDKFNTNLNVSVYNKLVYRFTNGSFGGSALDSDTNYGERHQGTKISFSRPFGKEKLSSLMIGFKYDNVETNPNLLAEKEMWKIIQNGVITAVNLTYDTDTRDLKSNAKEGSYKSISVEGGHVDGSEYVPSSFDSTYYKRPMSGNYIKSIAEYRFYHAFRKRSEQEFISAKDLRPSIAFRVRAGAAGGKLPFFEQFFVGGTDTLRGYDDDRYWGKYIVSANIEYRHPIFDYLTLVAFVDMGDAWGNSKFMTFKDLEQTENFKLHVGYGIGGRFNTPLGAMRLDWGFGSEGNKLHFSMGQSF
ncbi:MAG: BamA/TamA family outer membrane protein, partial [Armatimonadetes bacterium]|nr:BamA/TamA family outer membrane protein [Candidatus Hippobium faecium]